MGMVMGKVKENGERSVNNEIEVVMQERQVGRRSSVYLPVILVVKTGHKMWECPNNRVARIITPNPRKTPKIDGKIGDKQCKMTIDTGAQLTVVKPAMVNVEDYTGRCMVIEDYKGKQEKVK